MSNELKKEISKLELDIKDVTRTKSLLNENQIQKIWNSTPKRFKYTRPAKGGGNWTYIKAGYVRKVLDSVTGFNWDFEVETSLGEAFEVAKITKSCIVKGTITCRFRQDDEWVSVKKTQFGRSDVKMKKDSNEPLDFGNDMKAATSDCLKKCASLFGIGQDVYESEEFQEILITNSDEQSNKSKVFEKLINEAKEKIKNEI